tara:strand:- start:1005 stop:1421 length:417 start_codon:yes stop_codon:yes gene_type:complete
VVVLEVNQTYLDLLDHHIQVEVQEEMVDLAAVLDFILKNLVELHLVLLSLALLETLQIVVGDIMVVPVETELNHKTHSIIPVAAVALEVLDWMVETEHLVLEEQVELDTYSPPTFNYQHQLWHPLHMEIQDRVVVHTG